VLAEGDGERKSQAPVAVIDGVTHPAPVAEKLGLGRWLRNEPPTRYPPGAIEDDGPGTSTGPGQASAFFLFGKKISTGMYHTGHDFDAGIKSFQPLDEWK
jgi:hypothetical protein